MSETNWAGNVTYTAARLHRPTSLEQLQSIVRDAVNVRALGSRHTFNTIADSSELISLADLPLGLEIDPRAVRAPASITYGALAAALDAAGLALPNLASLPHVSVAGATATATHGSGNRNGNLATHVSGLELVTSSGELLRTDRGDPDFAGMVVNLGALGVVTRVTLDVEPTYTVRQTVYADLSWSALLDNFDAVTGAGHSVSLFTTWGDSVEQVWLKTRVTDASPPDPSDVFGASAEQVDVHPAKGMDPRNCTPQRGTAGPWWRRLTHFRVEYTPSVGDELQSEYVLAREHALDAIDVLRGLADRIRPLLIVSEIRTVAADNLWLSPMYGRDSVCLHFTWRPDQPRVEAVLVDLESALARFHARPHWGKLFLANAHAVAPLYPRHGDFVRLVNRLDPRGAFSNTWFQNHVLTS